MLRWRSLPGRPSESYKPAVPYTWSHSAQICPEDKVRHSTTAIAMSTCAASRVIHSARSPRVIATSATSATAGPASSSRLTAMPGSFFSVSTIVRAIARRRPSPRQAGLKLRSGNANPGYLAQYLANPQISAVWLVICVLRTTLKAAARCHRVPGTRADAAVGSLSPLARSIGVALSARTVEWHLRNISNQARNQLPARTRRRPQTPQPRRRYLDYRSTGIVICNAVADPRRLTTSMCPPSASTRSLSLISSDPFLPSAPPMPSCSIRTLSL